VEQRKLSPGLLAVILAVHATVTAFTWRDLRHRTEEQVRGSKKVWRFVSAMNTTGSLAYWLFGRKRVD
jgi:hypothetical protein